VAEVKRVASAMAERDAVNGDRRWRMERLHASLLLAQPPMELHLQPPHPFRLPGLPPKTDLV